MLQVFPHLSQIIPVLGLFISYDRQLLPEATVQYFLEIPQSGKYCMTATEWNWQL